MVVDPCERAVTVFGFVLVPPLRGHLFIQPTPAAHAGTHTQLNTF